jgi:hypothetical protein
LPQFRHLCQVLVCASLATGLANANTESSISSLPSIPAPMQPEMTEVAKPSYLEQLLNFSLFRFLTPSFAPVAGAFPETAELTLEPEPDLFPGCFVEPLEKLEDSEALAFENQTHGGLGAIDLDGLTPTTQLALARFQRMVTAAGGQISITSAYRPAAYQDHLRDVWETWMGDLRYNRDPLCQELRAQVKAEFDHHQLLERQRPVVASDHTRGLSFDASVLLPRARKGKRRRISVDYLARQAGVLRPDIRRDPVHFKLVM